MRQIMRQGRAKQGWLFWGFFGAAAGEFGILFFGCCCDFLDYHHLLPLLRLSLCFENGHRVIEL